MVGSWSLERQLKLAKVGLSFVGEVLAEGCFGGVSEE